MAGCALAGGLLVASRAVTVTPLGPLGVVAAVRLVVVTGVLLTTAHLRVHCVGDGLLSIAKERVELVFSILPCAIELCRSYSTVPQII